MKNSAYIVIAHGTGQPTGRRCFFAFLREFRKRFPQRMVEGAFLRGGRPGLAEAIEKCAAAGCSRIFIIPLLMFPGKHLKDDIPNHVRAARIRFPDVDFHFSSSLAEEPKMLEMLAEKAMRLESRAVRRRVSR